MSEANKASFVDKTISMHPVSWAVIGLCISAFLSGCGTVVGGTIAAANQIDQSRDQSRMNSLVAQHLDNIKALQAKGDPLGDYLWAEANENKLFENPIQDPQELKALYQIAADKGSIDARIVLGVKRFREGHFPRVSREGIEISTNAAIRQGRPIHPDITAAKKRLDEDPSLEETPLLSDLTVLPAKEAAWKDGLKQVEQATQRRCFFYRLYIFAPRQKRCLAPRIAADEIWPAFRNGGAYPKDKVLRDYWYDKAIACEQTPEYQAAKNNCAVFGASGYRAKD